MLVPSIMRKIVASMASIVVSLHTTESHERVMKEWSARDDLTRDRCERDRLQFYNNLSQDVAIWTREPRPASL